ncbi:MAG: CHAD domain-containing protein [Pseudomonas sp.]
MSEQLLDYLQTALSQQYDGLVQHVPSIDDPDEIEALHDTRIALRRLRSLLRPWREQGGLFSQVDLLAAELGRATGPWRDKQVLVGELQQLGLHYQAAARREALQTGLAVIADNPVFDLLAASILALQVQLATGGGGAVTPAALADYTDKSISRLAKGLKKTDFDLHDIRKKIKKLRYLFQAYPEHTAPGKKLRRELDRAQSELGNWHDRFQWLLVSTSENDLHCCIDYWQAEEDRRARRARRSLDRLRGLLKRAR